MIHLVLGHLLLSSASVYTDEWPSCSHEIRNGFIAANIHPCVFLISVRSTLKVLATPYYTSSHTFSHNHIISLGD